MHVADAWRCAHLASQATALRRKLQTRRPDGATPEFVAHHLADLGKEGAEEKGRHLAEQARQDHNRLLAHASLGTGALTAGWSAAHALQVARRQTLKQGVDVFEVDTWGMDCYTRKNVHDAGKPPGDDAAHLLFFWLSSNCWVPTAGDQRACQLQRQLHRQAGAL